MTKVTTTAEVQFSFEGELTNVAYEKIVKRVQQYLDGTVFETTASFFISRNDVRVFITYDITDQNERSIYDYLGRRLKTLIDWHKDAATYQWDHRSIVQAPAVKKASA
jgi:CRISPR/Cas system-associated endoribonuclease Cas2